MATLSEQEMIRMLYGLPAAGPASPVVPIQFDARRPGTTPMQSTMAGVPNVPAIPAPRVQEGSPPPAVGASLAFPQGGPTVSLPQPTRATPSTPAAPRAAAPATRAPATPKAATPAAPAGPTVISTGPAALPYGFRDPADAITAGIRQQGLYRDEGLAAIQALAARGDPNNYSYRLAALTGALGTNNFAGVQQQGIEALNRALGDMQQTELQTETARANALTSANAQLGAAGIGAAAQRYGDNLAMERFYSTPQLFGEGVRTKTDPLTKLPVSESYNVRAVPLRGGGFRELAPGQAREGTRVKLSDGTTAIMKDGRWVPVK